MNNKDKKIIKNYFKFLGKLFLKILIIFLVYALISSILSYDKLIFQEVEYKTISNYGLYIPNTKKEISVIKKFLKDEYPKRKFKKIKLTEIDDTRGCWGGGDRYSVYEVEDKNKRKYRFVFTFGEGLTSASYSDEYFRYRNSIDSNNVFLYLRIEKDFTDDDYEKMSIEATSFLKEKIDNKIPVKAVITYTLYETDDLETEIFYNKNKSYEENVQINSEIIKNFLQDIANETSKFNGEYFNCFLDVDLNNKTITKIELLDNYNFVFLEELSKNKTMKMSYELTNLLKEKADNKCLDTYLYFYYQPSKTETKIKIFYDNDKTYCENLVNNKRIIDDFLQRIVTIIYFNGCSA